MVVTSVGAKNHKRALKLDPFKTCPSTTATKIYKNFTFKELNVQNFQL